MSITLGSGITIASGIALGAGTPAPSGALTFNPAFNGSVFGNPALNFSNSNKTVLDNGPGEYSTLTTVQFVPGNKYMASFTLDYYTDPVSWIGVGNTSIDVQNGLGYDTNSIGFNSVGDYRFGNTVYGTGYCNFTNVGDVIDLAVDTSVNLMWIRVNGGNWNNNPSADPVTQTNGLATGGLNNGYFALAVGGYNFYSQFSINTTAQYSPPAGFTFLGASYSLTLHSSDLTIAYPFNQQNGHNYPIVLGTNGVEGFTIDLSHIPPDSSNLNYAAFTCYVPNINSVSVANFFAGAVTAGAISSAGQPTLYAVTWGAGSSIGSGYVIMSGTTSSTGTIFMAPVDTGVAGWNTSPPNNNTTQVLAGTFKFPATFTLVTPAINKGGWC